jgi:hypothetical protein
MKKLLFVLSLVVLLSGCKNEVVAPPKNLIPEDKMVNIIYDLALLEAIRSQPQQPGQTNTMVNPKTFVFKKYQIDSLQFAASNHYYASDIANYKKMYDEVKNRIETQQKQIDATIIGSHTKDSEAQGTDPDAPQVQ